jgi:2-phospho-L-lactate guanylyltransferase
VSRPVALVPIRNFTGMTRLSGTLNLDQRTRLSRTLASGVITAVAAAGLRVIVITSADDVAKWALEHKASVCEDRGNGLSEAAHAGVSMIGTGAWLVIHADLPLVSPEAIEAVASEGASATVIVPSYDGGTTVVAGRGSFPFSYGIGSFQRHYASAPDARIIVSPELSIDIDTPHGLELIQD